MSPGMPIRALLLAAATLAGPDALAAGLTLRAGALYTQSDSWDASGAQGPTLPHLDVDLGLNGHGAVASRDVLAYRFSAGYRRITDEVNGVQTSSSQSITYDASAAILNNRVSPVTLNLSAARGEVDFATDPSQDVHGRGYTNAAGAQLTLRMDGKPGLTASYNLTQTEQSVPGQEGYESTTHAFGSSLSFGTTAFQASAQYAGRLRDGTWLADDYATHDLTFSAWVPIEGQTLALESVSAFTIPDQLVPETFEQQTSSFRASYGNSGTTGNLRAFSYGYGHALTETVAAPAVELTRQNVRYEGDHLLTRETLFTRWLLDASMAQTRAGDAEDRSTGETLGVQLWWRRASGTTTWQVHAGPRVALLQTEAGDTTGFGASGRVRYSRPLWGHTFSADWNGNYQRELFATAGWQLTHGLALTLSGRAGSAQFDGSLRGDAFRTESPVTGAGAGRSLHAFFRATTRRLGLDARVAYQAGMTGATPSQFVGDGLLLPAPFDSHALDGALSASVRIFSGLSGHATARAARSEGPGRPPLTGAEAIAGISYAYGAFGLAVEDRLSRFEVPGGWNTANLVMVRAYRTFSWGR